MDFRGFGGGDDDEDDQGQVPVGNFPAGFPAGLLAQMQNMGGGAGMNIMNQLAGAIRPPPRAFDEYMKAFSVAMLDTRERANLSYGGKILMPPSALAQLTRLDIESPWIFQLRNPANSAASTHAGVLEFIAEEGCVYLPYWMMKTLRLGEGDPIRITGAKLPKGKFVKLQAQTPDFIEVSDPKAVLEQALRNFTTLTQGDIIEITYNSLTFELLIMEIKPEGAGILILDTDLEVDFATPKGYVEPKRPEPKPQPTMASKMKIDVSSAEKVNVGPLGAASGFEAFKGAGQSLTGRKTKGKGRAGKKIEEVDGFSKIIRTDKPRMMTSDTVDQDRKVPAALNLPFGQLFFGYPIVPVATREAANPTLMSPIAGAGELPTFTGTGQTLSGRPQRVRPSAAPPPSSPAPEVKKEDAWKGKGRSLSGRTDVIELD